MNRINTLVAVVGLTTCAVGCTSTRSSVGSFVTDVRVRGDQLEVERCRLDLEVINRDGLRFVLFPLMVFGETGLFTQRTPEVSRCATRGTQMLDTKGGAS